MRLTFLVAFALASVPSAVQRVDYPHVAYGAPMVVALLFAATRAPTVVRVLVPVWALLPILVSHPPFARAELLARIERAREILVASFANGVGKDEAAVRAAIASPWLVERTGRGPDHTPQAGEALNVRSRKDRPAPGQTDWRRMTLASARLHQNCVRAPIGCRLPRKRVLIPCLFTPYDHTC